MKKGLVETGRMDVLLARSVHICTWGSIDLLRDRIGMRVGIPGETIEKWLGVQDLSPDYVLSMAITGSAQNPEYDFAETGIKIASLAARGLSGEGTIGKWIKSWVPAVDREIAPPAIRPFPWEKTAQTY
jgi:hypothetical protein